MSAELLDTRIRAIHQRLKRIESNLRQLGYEFADDRLVMPGPERGSLDAIARIEAEVGTVPQALKRFWLIVGGVDFSGGHPDWSGCEYPDPLIVEPPSSAVAELDEFMADKEERLRCNYPYCIFIAPDSYHKAGVSGGEPYSIDVPATGDNPRLRNEPHETTLLEYLELATQWGGVSGP